MRSLRAEREENSTRLFTNISIFNPHVMTFQVPLRQSDYDSMLGGFGEMRFCKKYLFFSTIPYLTFPCTCDK